MHLRVSRQEARPQDENEGHHRAQLMRKAKRHRRGVDQRDDAKRHLHQQPGAHPGEGGAGCAMGRAAAAQRGDRAEDQHEIADHPVVELHQPRVFEEIAPQRREREGIRRQELPAHQRPVGEAAPGVDAGDQRAKQHLHEGQMQHPRRHAEEPRLGQTAGLQQLGLAAAQKQRIPGDETEDGEADAKVHGKTIGGDRGHAVAQARGHHPPADRALQPAEHTQTEQPQPPALRDPPRQRKAREARRPDQTDHPAKRAMRPFPPVDRLEPGQIHRRIRQRELRRRLILAELGLPVGVIQRRHDAGDRLPFGDREAGVAEPGRAAKRDHRRDQREKREQPDPDRGARAFRAGVDQPAFRRGGGGGLFGADLFEDAAFRAHGGLRRLGPDTRRGRRERQGGVASRPCPRVAADAVRPPPFRLATKTRAQ
ncbi:hypothetical protein SDC9_19586 [bioreactor metagenome]|uniref:Uncharacterized protein n=1 Tax=bioreactor metagenome TaxID=1076179 RepID=A0A644U4D5_9ZZZZ